MGDQIWKIKIEPYDQVLALTQQMINEGISNLYRLLEDGNEIDGPVKPKPGNAYADENNWVKNVIFGEPCVIVQPDYSNVRSVKFRMWMKSGKAQIRRFIKMDDDTGEPITEKLLLEIEEWHVTVPIDVGFVALDKTTPRGKAVLDRSAANGKPDHSIMEFLLDLESMAWGDGSWEFDEWAENDWMIDQDGKQHRPPGWKLGTSRSYTDLHPDFQRTLEFCFGKISRNLMHSNLLSMGFAVIAPKASQRATFEVNNVRYMTYPWTDPETNTSAPPGLNGNGRWNYLLYLETVGRNTPPPDSERGAVLDTRMGNWTDGRKPGTDSPSKFGTFILSSANFMESFVNQKLSAINRIMSMNIDQVTCWADYHFFTYDWEVTATYFVGHEDASKDSTTYALKQQEFSVGKDWPQSAKDFFGAYTGTPAKGSKVWRYQDTQWREPSLRNYTHKGTVEIWMSGDTMTLARAYKTAGSNTIVYEGRQWTRFEFTIDPSSFDPNIKKNIIAETKWTVTFQMQEVTDGGLQFQVDIDQPTTSFQGNYEFLANFRQGFEKGYKAAGRNFEWYINSIRNCLQGQEKFTLPASGVFFFKDPVMNAQGDLVCSLQYNGNPQVGQPINHHANVVRGSIPRGDFISLPGKSKIGVGDTEKSSRS
ncbi:uncharacterized protein FFB14_06275 [Fusarium fujikuroi]|nr:uncharacterized protein FFB14_06275 [Fusarium fujikuroi]